MNVRAILIGAGVAALGGFALYDYNSPDSRRARALHEVETLKPDVKPHSCLPPGPLSRAFAVAVTLDALPPTTFDSDARKRGLIKHDCIRGAAQHSTLDRLLDATGEDVVTYAAKVVESCPYNKNEYPVPECVALDVLGRRADASPAAVSALEKVATERKHGKEVWEGALYRLMSLPSWRTSAQLAARPLPHQPAGSTSPARTAAACHGWSGTNRSAATRSASSGRSSTPIAGGAPAAPVARNTEPSS